MDRIAIVLQDRCDGCVRCIKVCPLVHDKKNPKPSVIKVRKLTGKPIINTRQCIVCGICVNACHRSAIQMVAIPKELTDENPIHSYGENAFRLFRIPQMRRNLVIGLVGANGIGKTTILNILGGDLLPNGGKLKQTSFDEFLESVRTPGMREYLRYVQEKKIRVSYKKQVLKDLVHRNESIKQVIDKETDDDDIERIIGELELQNVLTRQPRQLSGGELQRFAIALTLGKDADVYLFDEPATYLDVKQRLKISSLIQEKAEQSKYCLVAEHDLAIMDFLLDNIHLVFGKTHAYGVISKQLGVSRGLNAFLLGEIREENINFRNKRLVFKRTVKERDWKGRPSYDYPPLEVRINGFHLKTTPGNIYQGEILVILGENGLGKTTFAKEMIGASESDAKIQTSLSYKPQVLSREYDGLVEEFLTIYQGRYSQTKELKKFLFQPLNIKHLQKRPMAELSGGELQRVFLAGCLGRKAEIYIIDEGSAFLDVEERLKATRVIRHWAQKRHVAILAIEHDIQIAEALGDRILLFGGIPGKEGRAFGPFPKRDGMNRFLKHLDITFRRDPETGRARINKKGSQLDRRQREKGEYYYTTGTDVYGLGFRQRS